MWSYRLVVLRLSTVIRRCFHRLKLANDLLERLDFFLNFPASPHHLFDRRNRMHGRAVIAVEFLADVVEGKIEQLSAKVDGNLPRVDDVSGSLRTDEVAVLDLEEGFNLLLNVLDGQISRRTA